MDNTILSIAYDVLSSHEQRNVYSSRVCKVSLNKKMTKVDLDDGECKMLKTLPISFFLDKWSFLSEDEIIEFRVLEYNGLKMIKKEGTTSTFYSYRDWVATFVIE